MIVAGAITAAVGVVAVGAGITFGVLAQQASDKLSSNDVALKAFDASLYQSGQRDQVAEGVLLGVGAAAVVAGGILAILGSRRAVVGRAAVVPTANGVLVHF